MQYSNVFICFLVEKGATNKVRTQQVGDGGVIQNAYNSVQGEWRGVSRIMCTYALTLSLFMFLAAFLAQYLAVAI